jgi:hypothetical protein
LGSTVAIAAIGTASVTAAAAAPSITNFPRQALTQHGQFNTWSASNWSGYAETGTFTGVSSTWTVPAVTASTGSTYSSAWIGVDGFNNSNLIQTGTEEDYYSGAAHYNAWWEILPAPETPISTSTHPVAPGDTMTASIYETSATVVKKGQTVHLWTISIADTTKGWTFSTSQPYRGAGTSSEWILEAPQVGGRIATLAHYTITPPANTGDFDNAGILSTIVPTGTTPTYTGANLDYTADSGVMIQKNVQVSTPGNPDTPLTAFNTAYGSTVPPTPNG